MVISQKLRAEQAKQLIKTGADIPQATLSGQYGKFNSALIDNSVGVSQSFSLPGVYSRQKQQLSEEWKLRLLNVDLKQSEVKKMTSSIFYELLVIGQKQLLLAAMDSTYNEFLRIATLRFKAGETNMLEKASAENQLIQINRQKKELEKEFSYLQQQFMLLINSEEMRLPEAADFKLSFSGFDRALLEKHPFLKQYVQQEQVAKASTSVAKSKLFPEISIGYQNMSLQDGIRYDLGSRFHSFQLGLGIPIFSGAQKARIKSAKTQEELAINETTYARKQLQAELEDAHQQLSKNKEIVQDFENNALKNAREITQTLNKQLQKGEINYLEWTMLNQQALALRMDYLNAINNLNNSIIELNYLLSK